MLTDYEKSEINYTKRKGIENILKDREKDETIDLYSLKINSVETIEIYFALSDKTYRLYLGGRLILKTDNRDKITKRFNQYL